MKQKSSGLQIIRKVEVEKPTSAQAFLTGFFLAALVLVPLMIAASITTRIWTKIGTTDFAGIYFGIGLGLVLSLVLSFIFMKLATR